MVLPALDNSQMMLIGVLDLLNLFITRFTHNFLCYSQRWKAIFIACQVNQFRTLRRYPHFQDLSSRWPTNYFLCVLIFFFLFSFWCTTQIVQSMSLTRDWTSALAMKVLSPSHWKFPSSMYLYLLLLLSLPFVPVYRGWNINIYFSFTLLLLLSGSLKQKAY